MKENEAIDRRLHSDREEILKRQETNLNRGEKDQEREIPLESYYFSFFGSLSNGDSTFFQK